MKKISIAFLCVLSSACSLTSMIQKEEITAVEGTYRLQSGPIALVEIDIDSSKGKTFMFDTGASRTLIRNLMLLSNRTSRNYASFGSNKTADGIKHPNKFTLTNIKTPWFSSEKTIVSVYETPDTPCPEESGFDGVIGLAQFRQANVVLELFYGDSVINSRIRENYGVPLDKGFKNVNAVFKNNMIFIPLTIAGKTELYLLDSGSNAAIITTLDKAKEKEMKGSTVILGKSLKGLGDKFGEETIFGEMQAALGDIDFGTLVMMQRTGYQMNNMGIGAMRLFDWIIDFEDERVYAKRNAIESTMPKMEKYYFSGIVDGNLEIISKIKGHDDYAIGDKIISVNGVAVDAQNICKAHALLAQAKDWSTLRVVIAK